MMELNDNICLICLRTDRILKTAPATLSKYHNEMTNHCFDIKQLNYCCICEHLLRKAYKFHQKCLTATKILKNWENSTASNKTPIDQLHLKLFSLGTLGPWTADNNKVFFYNAPDEDSLDVIQANAGNSFAAPMKVPKLEIIPLLETPAVEIKQEIECDLEETNIEANVDPQYTIDNIEVKEIKYTPDDTHAIEVTNTDIGNNKKVQKTLNTQRRIKLDRDVKVEETELEDDTMYLSDDDCNDDTIDEVKQLDYTSGNDDNENIANNDTSDDDSEDKDDAKTKPIALKIMSTIRTLNETLAGICQDYYIPALTHMAEDITTEEVKKLTHEYLVNKMVTNRKAKRKTIKFKIEGIDADLSTIISESKDQVRDFNADLTSREWLILKLAKNIRAWGELNSEEGMTFDTESVINCLDRVSQKNIKQLHTYFSDTKNSRILPVDIARILKNSESKLKDEEYASVFEIIYLTTEKAKIEEFQQRKTYECYLQATFKCEKCFLKCKNSGLLELHNKTNHDESNTKYICSICPVRRVSKRRLTHHMNLHDEVFKCKLCPLVTYYRSSMIQHYLQHSGKCEYKCEKCDKTFRSLSVFLTHNSQYHPRGAHICGICGGSYISRVGLKGHITRKHPGATKEAESDELKCGICDFTFSSLEEYSEHSRNYHRTFVKKDLSQVKCEYCNLLFRTKTECSNHLMSAHGLKKKKPVVRCRVCSEVGDSAGWVKLHYIMHHPTVDVAALYAGNKTHLCEICGKGFSVLTYLQDHMNTHKGITVQCSRCPKRFASKLALQRHERIHDPPRFTCKYCGKKFYAPSNLSNHVRCHIRDRRYKCDLCDKGFLHRSALTAHIRGVHNNERRVRKPRLASRRTRNTMYVAETDEAIEATNEVTEAIDEAIYATDEMAETIEGMDIIDE